ncbi:MAG: DUF2225 domain-containing protein [Clostridia bacterium]|nr:DUF2225 domain-containing protein [Clostridia bacterium]
MDCTVNLGMLKSLSRAIKVLQGEAIICDGLDKKMFIVLKGEAGAFSPGKSQGGKPAVTYGPGDFFGESTLFLGKTSLYNFVALSDLIMLQISRCSFGGFLRDEPELTFELMKALFARLERADIPLEAPGDDRETVPKSAPAPPPTTPCAAAEPPSASAPDPSQRGFSLFPEGHGCYTLPLCIEDRVYLMEKNHSCPLCKHRFKSLKVKPSKLVAERTDSDMRVHFKGIEPLYYDVVTCPNCFYSALDVMFGSLDKPATGLLQELSALKSDTQLKFSTDVDAGSVFAGYYLALHCAPKSFSRFSLAEGKLLLNLSRVYADCGDAQMEQVTAKRALETYLYAYENIELSQDQYHQLCMIIGNLNVARNDFVTAKNFFFKVKTSRNCTPKLKRHAEDRLYDIRELECSPHPEAGT